MEQGCYLMKYKVPIKSLKAVINPLDGKMWKVAAIDPQEVLDAANQGIFSEQSWAIMKNELPPEMHRPFHIARIAQLLCTKVDSNDPYKLILAVYKDEFWFYDGNHRVAAAIVRGDDSITLQIVTSGEQDLAVLLPGLIPVTDNPSA